MKDEEATFLTEVTFHISPPIFFSPNSVSKMRGVSTDAYIKPAFDQAGVADLCKNWFNHDGSAIRHLFVAVDPAAGGALSDYAIVSAFFTKEDQLVICGAETHKGKDNSLNAALVIQHIMALRRLIKGASDARVVFVPESNLATEHMWATREMRHSGLGQFCVMREDNNNVGTRTTKELKHTMALLLNTKIVRRNIFVLNGFVSVVDGSSTEDMLNKLLDQMKNYSRIVKPPRDKHHGSAIVSYTGKSGHGHDDLVIAIQLLNAMHGPFWSKIAEYGQYH